MLRMEDGKKQGSDGLLARAFTTCPPALNGNVRLFFSPPSFFPPPPLSPSPPPRAKLALPEKTVSLWSWVNCPQELERLSNPLYEPNSLVIWPSVAPQSLQLWEGKTPLFPPISLLRSYPPESAVVKNVFIFIPEGGSLYQSRKVFGIKETSNPADQERSVKREQRHFL